jgi:hypothetical protein
VGTYAAKGGSLMDRDMKWHIYDANNQPLCWEDQALEFDFDSDACEFLNSAISNSEHDIEFYSEAEIRQDTLYYDGGYLNATHLRVAWDEETNETTLINVNN